jgi:Tfp pilus assembly protein PilX
MATALMVLMVAMITGMATITLADTENRESGTSRTREAAFNLAEGALNAQIFQLSRAWAGQGRASTPYTPCTQASGSAAHCPSPEVLAGMFRNVDTTAGSSWRTSVHDNASPSLNFYDDALTQSQPGYDANGDGRLWVRATGRAAGRSRTLVALVRVEEHPETIPRAALIAGELWLHNNGKKVLIDATGGSAGAALVAVRCDPGTQAGTACIVSTGGANNLPHQISPYNVQTSHQGAALTPEALERLKLTARADGRLYATCPSALPSARVVWIESGSCNYTGTATINSPSAPGMVIQETGTLRLAGSHVFYGLLYHPNKPNLAGIPLITVDGNAEVHGGVIVEGPGVFVGGSSKVNITILDVAFSSVVSYGTAGIIQNTWREIRPAASN